jgi:hypothetical protein
VKLLSDNQQAQTKLRDVLRSTYVDAAFERRQPTPKELATLHHPYIDAMLEEILRCASTAAVTSRLAMVDTDVLGFHIPKGTDVNFLAHADYIAPPIGAIEERKRSPSSQASKDKTGVWEVSDISVFKPERWLKTTGEKGKVEFTRNAGPSLPFGAGIRGCFGMLYFLFLKRIKPSNHLSGRKLAYIELRMLVVFIVWNFELLPVPGELSAYLAVDKVTHQPQKCYLRLKKADW